MMQPVSKDPSEFTGLGPIPGQRSHVSKKSDDDPMTTPAGVSGMTWHPVAAGALVVELSGVMDAPAALALRDLLDEQLGLSRWCRVVLDLTAITDLPRDGVELLVGLHRRAHIDGFVVVLVGSSRAEVERALQGAGALPLFATRPSVRHALAGLTAAIVTTG